MKWKAAGHAVADNACGKQCAILFSCPRFVFLLDKLMMQKIIGQAVALPPQHTGQHSTTKKLACYYALLVATGCSSYHSDND